jgi:hypothetical protein
MALQPGEVLNPLVLAMYGGEKAAVVRYMPVTGKDKFLYYPLGAAKQLKDLLAGALLTTVEDVVTTGTTLKAMNVLKECIDVTENLYPVAVAKEGNGYTGQIGFAIELPLFH